jgi:hypothetical protein
MTEKLLTEEEKIIPYLFYLHQERPTFRPVELWKRYKYSIQSLCTVEASKKAKNTRNAFLKILRTARHAHTQQYFYSFLFD